MKSRSAALLVALACLAAFAAFAQAPVIDSFTPTSGPIGTSVTISGSNFGANLSDNIVYFGPVRATVTAAATNSLTVAVPAGATYQPTTVTTGGLTGASKRYFLPTFRGSPPFSIAGFSMFYADNAWVSDPLLGDFDGDGKVDVATTAIFGGAAGFALFRNTSTAGATPSFAPMSPLYPSYSGNINQNPLAQTVVDLDGDGKLDLVLSGARDFLLIYRNISSSGILGASSFADPVIIDLPQFGYGLAVGDIDGDGRPDIALASIDFIRVYRNQSTVGVITSNSFAPPVSFAPNLGVYTITIADLDGDGKPDLAGPSTQNGGIVLLRNTSAEPAITSTTFADPVLLSIGAGSYVAFATADLDGDGKLDLVTMRSQPTTISILRNVTDGPGLGTNSFSHEADFFGPYAPNGALAAGDLNGDGKPDLVALFRYDQIDTSVQVFLNHGSPGPLSTNSFTPPFVMSVGSTYLVGLALADIDGDGKPDIVCPRPSGLAVFPNITPLQPNAPPTVSIASPTNGSVFINPVNVIISAEAADTDGTVTQVVFRAGSIVIGASTVSPVQLTWSNAFAGTYALTATATDNSGNSTTSAGVTITVSRPPPVIESFTPASGPIGTSVTISGRNFGGFPEQNIVYFGGIRAVVTSAGTNSLVVTVPASATYEPITVTTAGLTAASKRPFIVTFRGSQPVQFDGYSDYGTDNVWPDANILIGDLDGDGKPEMIGTGSIPRGGNGSSDGGFLLFRNTSIPGTLGSGSFAHLGTLYPDYPNATMSAASAAVADLDGDGKLDLVIIESNPALLVVYRNISDTSSLDASSFAPPILIDLPNVLGSRHGLGITDLDGDGRPDILLCGYNGLSAFRNLASPGTISSNSFALPVDVYTNAIPAAIAIADFDLDGKPDIALLADGGVALLRNIATGPGISYGIFADPVMLNYTAGQPPVTLVTVDMDGDGKTDLITYQYGGDCCSATITLFRNLTSGPGLTPDSFGGKVEIPIPYYQTPSAVAAGDLNGDGKLDLVVLTPKFNIPDDARVSIFLNENSPGSLNASSFVPEPDLHVNYSYTPNWLAVEDMDGDGKNDIVLSRPTSNGGYFPKGYFTIYHNSTPPPPNQPPTVSIVSPTNGSVFVTPIDITISVDAGDSDGTVTQVLLYVGSDLVGASATSPFTITWSNVLAGGYTLTATAFDDSGNSTTSTGVNITVNPPPVAPLITVPPQDRSVTLGSNATFTATASGTAPLSYRWLFNATNLLSSTSASLTLTNVQFSQGGDYSVVVTNAAGSVTSAPARLTVIPPGGRLVQALNASGAPGSTVQIPIVLVGQGDENAVGFSLGFPNSLSYVTAELGGGASDAILNINAGQAASGRVGISLALSAGASFPAGTQELVVVTFSIAPEIGNSTAAISFGDQPLAREISDALANSLPGLFAGSSIAISGGGYEADVSPAPDGNGAITVTDWVKVGRYAAGLDTVSNASQFQRADCAPRSSLGNGAITITDWVQAGRYAAGLDPLTSAGGPTGPGGASPAKFGTAGITLAAREIRASRTAIYPGQTNRLSVVLVAQGNESAVGFTVNFDTQLAKFLSASSGANAGGAVFNLNTSAAGSGRVGIALSLPIGTAFAAGTQEIAVIRFAVPESATGSNSVLFGDDPVKREVSDVLANSVVANYSNGSLQVVPSLRIARDGDNHLLSWPSWAGNFTLEATDVLGTGSLWASPVAIGTNISAGEIQVITRSSSTQQFFRLRLP